MTDDNVVDLGAERARRRPETPMSEHLDALHDQAMQPGGLFGGGQPGSWRTQDPRTRKLSEQQFSRAQAEPRKDSRFMQGLSLTSIMVGIGLQQMAERSLPPTNPISTIVAPTIGAAGFGGFWFDQFTRRGSMWNRSRGRGPEKG